MAKKNIAVIGGGTGTSVVLKGLKEYQVLLSAVITTADDGSSSGVLRRTYKMVPPGDARQCLVALAGGDFGYLHERFESGFLKGHALGNLLIALFYQKRGNIQEALDEILKAFNARGAVVPATLKPTTIVAKLRDGRALRGEKNITASKELQNELAEIKIFPLKVRANPRALTAIKEADAIVVGPGNFYSSIIPVILIPEIGEAIKKSTAKKIYIANALTQPGHTDGFSPEDFLSVFSRYLGEDIFDKIICNSASFSEATLRKYKNAGVGRPVAVAASSKRDKRFVARSLMSALPMQKSASDPIAHIRNPFVHDSQKLARVIMELL